MEQDKDILGQVEIIRDYVNEPRNHYGLFQDKPMFFQLSSSMDVIEDTQLAIQAYSQNVFENDNHMGELYLAIYGLLQAIYVQQDAIINLSESLRIPENINSYQRLAEIRSIRNDSIGHPTKRDFEHKHKKGEKKKASYHFITRISLSKNGFDLLSWSGEGDFKSRYINIDELIADQRIYISEILEKIMKKLQQEENDHKARFRNEKLKEIFHSSTSYSISKIHVGIRAKDSRTRKADSALALGGLETVSKYLFEFNDALKRRDVSRYEALQDEYVEIEFTSQWLRTFLERKMAEETIEKSDELMASIFIYFFDNKVKSLIQYAEEIDEEYSENV